MKAHVPHQPGDRAARDREAFPPQLPPDLAHAIDAEVLIEHPPDLDFKIRVAPDPLGQAKDRRAWRRGRGMSASKLALRKRAAKPASKSALSGSEVASARSRMWLSA